MSWESKVRNWDGKLYKVLLGNNSRYGNFEWDLPKNGKPGNWTPTIEDVEMCKRGYHLTTHYTHWSFIDDESAYYEEDDIDMCKAGIFIYEAEGDVVEFDGYDKVVCTRARLLKLVGKPFNENNSGYRNSGYCNHGYYNSGNWNSGRFNSGNWNIMDYNSGYFCTGYRSDEIFNKPIPKDWEPKFPEWMYFKLLLNGYRISWQKAFESADIKGIKELLNLPNFDYDIFERITSITKEQISEKLGE